MRTNGKYQYCTAQQALSGGMKEADPVEMWEAGSSLHQIAVAMGVTCGEVADTLVDEGFYLRTRIDTDYIEELARAGATNRDMAVEFGVTVQRICKYMRENLPEFYKPSARTPRLGRVAPQIYLRLAKGGATINAIAVQFGVTINTMWDWLDKHPEMPLPKYKLDIDRGKIRALYKAGPQWHPSAISFDVCLPERVVKNVLHEMAEAGELRLREEDK